jgi:hypothetical protein
LQSPARGPFRGRRGYLLKALCWDGQELAAEKGIIVSLHTVERAVRIGRSLRRRPRQPRVLFIVRTPTPAEWLQITR